MGTKRGDVTAEELREKLSYDSEVGIFWWRATGKVAGWKRGGRSYGDDQD